MFKELINLQFKRPVSKQAIPNRLYNSRYNIYNRTQDDQRILEKALDGNELKKIAGRYKTTPYWSIYQNMFGQIPSVTAAINKKKNTVLSPGWKFVDPNGYTNYELTDTVNKLFRLRSIFEKQNLQYDTYGTVIYTHYAMTDYLTLNHEVPKPVFKLIPAGETRNYTVDLYTSEITSFSWQESDVYNFQQIDLFDKNGDRNFYIGRIEDVDDQFLGQPLLRPLYTILDGWLQDEENYQLFLKNASFPGIVAMVSGQTEQITIDELNGFFDSLRDKEQRFKASVIQNATDSEGNPMVNFTTIKQAIENRLKLDEKQEIYGLIDDCLGVTRKTMGQSTSGMGANEYETAMTDFKLTCLDARVDQITEDYNSFINPKIMKYLDDSGYFRQKQFKIKVDNQERIATKGDYKLCFNNLEVETNSQKRESYLRGYELGIFAASEVKEKGFDFEEKDLLDDDKFRKFSKDDIIIKEGELKSGPVDPASQQIEQQMKLAESGQSPVPNQQESNQPDNGIKPVVNIKPVQDQGQDIAENQTESSEEEKSVSNINNNFVKSLDKLVEIADLKIRNSGKVKKMVNTFFSKAIEDEDNYSRVPEILESTKAKQEKERLNKSFTEQYGDLDILLLLSLIYKNNIDLSLPESRDQINNLVSSKINKIEDYIDVDNLIESMLFASRLGLTEIERQLNTKLSEVQKKQIQKQVNNFSKERVKNLLGYRPKELPEFEDEVLNPYYDGSLDQTSINQVTDVIRYVMSTYPTLNQQAQSKLIEEELVKRAEQRAGDVTNDNLAKAFAVGTILAALELKAKKKTWLKTKARFPRETHLRMVGETVDFDKPFSNGSKWTQEEINCQCSIKVSNE